MSPRGARPSSAACRQKERQGTAALRFCIAKRFARKALRLDEKQAEKLGLQGDPRDDQFTHTNDWLKPAMRGRARRGGRLLALPM